MEKPGRTVYLTLIKIFRQDHTEQITSFACKNCNFLNGEKASIWCLSAVENIWALYVPNVFIHSSALRINKNTCLAHYILFVNYTALLAYSMWCSDSDILMGVGMEIYQLIPRNSFFNLFGYNSLLTLTQPSCALVWHVSLPPWKHQMISGGIERGRRDEMDSAYFKGLTTSSVLHVCYIHLRCGRCSCCLSKTHGSGWTFDILIFDASPCIAYYIKEIYDLKFLKFLLLVIHF